MSFSNRLLAAMLALLWAAFASVAVARHFSGQPDGGARWLSAAPVLFAALMVAALLGEAWQRGGGVPTGAAAVVRLLQWLALALMCWRSLWMMFSWDGLLYLPAWTLMALALLRPKPHLPDCA